MALERWRWSDGLAAHCGVELAAPGWISVDLIRHAGGDAQHQDADGDGNAAANVRRVLELLISPKAKGLDAGHFPNRVIGAALQASPVR
jgi:hypothetical protein